MTPKSPTKDGIAKAVQKVRKARFPMMWQSISARQAESTQKRPAVRGPLWVSQVTLPNTGENDIPKLVIDAVARLDDRKRGDELARPTVESVQAEWVGYRKNVSSKEAEPLIGEEKKYAAFMREVTSPVTIIHLFGGNSLYVNLSVR